MADLALYTDSFPYCNSETFLETELIYLSKAFETITIFPIKGSGEPRPVPSNVRVTEPLMESEPGRLMKYLAGIVNINLLFSEPSLNRKLSQVSFIKALKYVGYGILIKKRLFRHNPGQFHLHYSYWSNYWVVALSLARREKKISCFVARGHRYDLYIGQGENALDFLKDMVMKYIDTLYLISGHGLTYINGIYPEHSGKFKLSRLGTPYHVSNNPSNKSDSFIIVSCSGLRPVKRVDLILEALIILSIQYPALKVKWFHLGDGELFENIRSSAKEKLSGTNIEYLFKGKLSNQEVMEFYKNQPVDVFINVSLSEGLPVSLMEAQSYGIPVLATSSGGVNEIVNDETGKLIDVKITSNELADILHEIFIDIDQWRMKGDFSRKMWSERYKADQNYTVFAQNLKKLVAG